MPVPSQESERSCICVLGVHFIEVPAPGQESERSCICVLEVSILSLSTNFLWDFGNVRSVWYLFILYFMQISLIIRQFHW